MAFYQKKTASFFQEIGVFFGQDERKIRQNERSPEQTGDLFVLFFTYQFRRLSLPKVVRQVVLPALRELVVQERLSLLH